MSGTAKDLLAVVREEDGAGHARETWTLNAPASRNALTDAMVEQLLAACERARGDAQLRFIVLRGAGGHFCAGGSLGGFADSIGQPPGAGVDPLIEANRSFGRLLEALCALPQWLLAAVEGAAMGGGLGLVACADQVLAAADAQFAAPEVTLGVVPAQIAPFLVWRLGAGTARQWLLQGQRYTAQQALNDGLVQQIAGHDFEQAIEARLQVMRVSGPLALASTKRLLWAMEAPRIGSLLDTAAREFAQALRRPEAAQGLKAFAARAKAPWHSEEKA
ncbi:enoyl-CoA hydratase/isomerase family protein [Comamonas composti]|uniref:enoyl-CoA hydratase/isomerase family protein n=1 Tax=Comamonas composti TaxID=408558 RepID=UPI000400E953|nr:enoyl-CoA hydratase/isomerase family protein [Comamonas composti]